MQAVAVPFHTTPPFCFFCSVWGTGLRGFQAQVAVAGAAGLPLPRLRAEPAVVAVPFKPPPPDPPRAPSEGSSAGSSPEQPEIQPELAAPSGDYN